MTWKQMMAATFPLLLTTSLLVWRDHLPVKANTMTLSNTNLTCSTPPHFQSGYKQDEASLLSVGQGFKFQGVSWLEIDLCSSGILQLTAAGEIANGQAPILQIALNSEVLSVQKFTQRRTVNLHIPVKGRLTLGYFNDYYLADVRVATLENLSLSGSSCKTINVLVPKETGGQWIPENQTATLVSNTPITVIPCAAGTLSLQVVGRAGLGEFPVLNFKQNKIDRLEVRTSKNFQRIQLEINGSPLTVTLMNPYGKTLADRNLNLYSVSFTPDDVKIP